MLLTYRSDNHESMSSLMRRFAFDNPKSNNFYPNSNSFSIKGWCIPSNPNDKISIFVEHTNKPVQIYDLSIDRPDVISSLKINIEEYSYKKFGFDIVIESKNLKSIGFTINSSIYIDAWRYTESKENPTGIGEHEEKSTPRPLKNLLEEAIKIFSHHKSLKNIDLDSLNEILLSKAENFTNIDIDLVKTEEINKFRNKEIIDLIQNIQAETSSNKWNDDAIKRLQSGGSFFAFSKDVKVHSNFIAGDMSYILFSLGNYFFYFCQYCGNIGVFFPTEKAFFSFTKIDSWALICIEKIKKILHLTIKKFIADNKSFIECRFSGILLAQARPYHFFYDGLYSLANIAQDNLGGHPILIKAIREYCFLDPSKIFSPREFTSEIISENIFNKQQSEHSNGFYILACNQYHLEKKFTTIDFLDKKIIESTKNSKLCRSELVRNLLGESNFTLWIGISSEKRNIENLSTKIRDLVEKLAKYSKIRLTICFDGRTFPLEPSEQDISFFNIETRKIKDIQNQLPSNIVCLNLSGMSSIDKLFIAKRVDYFFCSFATDSLYVSRICKKPGFAYYPSNAIGALGMHIHPQAELIKCETPQENTENPWHISDSIIDWDLLTSRIEHHLINMEAACG